MTERHDRGREKRRAVLGAAHVAASEEGRTALDGAFQDLVTEAAWGTVWSSDGLTDRERSMTTLALLAGLGNWEELALHLRATANTGASRRDVAEVFQHVAIYAGVPRANTALKIARRVFDEMDGT